MTADQSTAPRSEIPMPETAAPTKREFVLRVTQDWEYRITAEDPEDAEAHFNEYGGGEGMCTGYSVEAIVSADKENDYNAEDERAKCTCGHLLDSDHSHTGCHTYRCDCTGATPLPLSPVEQAEALGHTAESDPPHALSSVSRWTCTVCGSAVLSRAGVVYGSAIEKTCTAPTP